jgi:U3 small nucleolar RNA-associated protein 22
MPAEIFQDKDYLNYRYFHKRAYYLTCISKGIEEAEDCTFAIEFAYQNDSDLQPVIIVKPGEGKDDFSKSKSLIRIILAAEGDLFPISRTLPDKNCIRPKVEGPTSQQNSPTPFYNASLRSECSSIAYLKYLHAASLQSDQFSDACILGSVWIRQRGLGHGGFGSFEWACTMALLMQGGHQRDLPVLLRGYSSFQLFKATLKYIATKDLVATPVVVQSIGNEIAKTERPAMFDGSRGMNILFKMTPWSYANLRHEASLTLKVLGDPLSNQFNACFISRIDGPLHKFDCIVTLPISSQHTPTSQQRDAISDDTMYCQKLYHSLKAGLRDRAMLIYMEPPQNPMVWPRIQTQSLESQGAVQVGLLLNPEQVNRTVERGPSAEDKESAAIFRRFWGEKAELRRYKDGSIQESLIWSSSEIQGSVLRQIVTHIVRRHIGDEAAVGLEIVGESFDRLLSTQSATFVEPVSLYQAVMSAFETAEKDIRSLDGLPLQIRHISAADSQLRYASVRPPGLDPVRCMMDPANICVQFEGSSRWPDDLSAVQRTKIAFLLKIGELLEELTAGLTTRLGLENADRKLVNVAFLDILYPSGAFFRMRIHHERELNLLERTLKGDISTAASREEIASALSLFRRDFVQAPLHTQAVRTLSTRFPLLSPCMRLMKKWRDSHLLSSHISDEFIEILTIRTFVHPYPWSVPGSIMTGFLRTLTSISKWDWRSDPLIVDFNNEMTSQDIDAIKLRFKAWRQIDPAMNRVAMFVASNVDRDGNTWTESSPSKVVAARFISLAKAACVLLQEQGMSLKPEALFAASTRDYDFVIHLNERFIKDKQVKDKGRRIAFKNLQIQASEDRGLAGFKPVHALVEELRKLYGGSILFLHNERECSVIAGLWNPQTGPRPWKVNIPYSTMPVLPFDEEGADNVCINKAATLHAIARLGGDMVSQIDVNQ